MLSVLRPLLSAAILTATAVQAHAGPEPWSRARPAAMSNAHETAAQAAAAAQSNVRPKIAVADWGDASGYWRSMPLANVSRSKIPDLLQGRYHVFRYPGDELWSVRYFGTDGVTYHCENTGDGYYQEWEFDRYVRDMGVGFYGLLQWHPEYDTPSAPGPAELGQFPIVFNPDTGILTTYEWGRREWDPQEGWSSREWISQEGWLQAEYAEAFDRQCVDLPRTSTVNRDQDSDYFADLIRPARPIRGGKVLFMPPVDSPLTAEMFYWANPPAR